MPCPSPAASVSKSIMDKNSSSENGAAASKTEDLVEEAHKAHLRYFLDDKPGLARRAKGKEFVYLDAAGKRIRNADTISRIRHLVIPPAWKDVWICPVENGHLQASGRDQRGRKQYRYHERWREQRDESKFHRMTAFARVLPRIRRRVRRDLKLTGMPREKVLATVVSLLESSLIRVGNDEYARENKSYGLTTMRNRHVKVSRDRIRFQFRGKSGKLHEISVQDRRLATIVKRCQDLPGQDLFTYEDETGAPHSVSSQDVNDYLHSIAGNGFTAKDFRTWAGTVLAAVALREFKEATGVTRAKKNITTAIEAVAKMLGNTSAVCRKCYIHPAILDSYLGGKTIETLQRSMTAKIDHSLSKLKPEEAAVLILLKEGLKKNPR